MKKLSIAVLVFLCGLAYADEWELLFLGIYSLSHNPNMRLISVQKDGDSATYVFEGNLFNGKTIFKCHVRDSNGGEGFFYQRCLELRPGGDPYR
jgi:hypothetical protein